MRPAILATAALAGIAAAAVLARRRLDEAGQGDALLPGINLANLIEESTTWADAMNDETGDRNLSAFLGMIRQAEGTAQHADPYRVMFGHVIWTGDMADHPRRAVQFTDKKGRRLWTSAAGAYQFMARSPIPDGSGRWTGVDTWDRLARRLRLPDFGPDSQDRAAVALIDEAGALRDVRAGNFEAAVSKVRRIWASLPGAGHDQPERSLQWARAAYEAAGGTYA